MEGLFLEAASIGFELHRLVLVAVRKDDEHNGQPQRVECKGNQELEHK